MGRLGLQVSIGDRSRICHCGELVDTHSHLLTCRKIKGGEQIRRHNDVVNILVKHIRSAGGIAKAEPASISYSNGDRVDIDAHLGSLHLHIDVRITNPETPSYTQVAMKPLGAASAAEKEKKKHGRNAERVGALFVPYVVETLGGLGKDAQTL